MKTFHSLSLPGFQVSLLRSSYQSDVAVLHPDRWPSSWPPGCRIHGQCLLRWPEVTLDPLRILCACTRLRACRLQGCCLGAGVHPGPCWLSTGCTPPVRAGAGLPQLVVHGLRASTTDYGLNHLGLALLCCQLPAQLRSRELTALGDQAGPFGEPLLGHVCS